jgi:riboflavin synthase alpha subunit
MFTGIIQHLGRVVAIEPGDSGAVLRIDQSGWNHLPAEGDSVCINGCCLTVATGADPRVSELQFDVVPQTLRMTTLGDLRAGDPVNLEHSVTPTTLMGGHIVQGHVDGVGVVRDVNTSGGEWRVRIAPPAALMEFIVEKGSVAVDGVSLTVANLLPDSFEVVLVPTTLRLTTLSRLGPGSRVNLEADYIAKTVVSWLRQRGC